MEEKITIIEGPTPTFELVQDVWANGIAESSTLSNIAVTHLRTYNGHSLLERCHKAWRNKDMINLEFRAPDGMALEVPIVAARTTEGQDGELLLLWVRLPEDEIEIEFEFEDDDHQDNDDEDEDDEPFDMSL